MASGTDALLIALLVLRVHAGNKVIAVLCTTTVQVDFKPASYYLDQAKIKRTMSECIRVIIAVGLYSEPYGLHYINAFAVKNDLPVIQDRKQSFRSQNHGYRSCSIRTISTTSLYPSKDLDGDGDNGAFCTGDRGLESRMWRVSRLDHVSRYFHTELSVNGRVTTTQAVALMSKRRSSSETEARSNIVPTCSGKLHATGITTLPQLAALNTRVCAHYSVQVYQRAEVQASLEEQCHATNVENPTVVCKQRARWGKQSRCNLGCATPLDQAASEPKHKCLAQR